MPPQTLSLLAFVAEGVDDGGELGDGARGRDEPLANAGGRDVGFKMRLHRRDVRIE